jgi:putative PIN family toxin of toxin-antitoxin system
MRVVLDTNVLVSSLITSGKPARLVERLFAKDIELVISKPMLEEFVEVIARPKFQEYASQRTIKDFLELLLSICAVVDVKSRFDITSDRSDNAILATAYDGKADYIVSGDKHLLQLKKFRKTRVVTVDEMLRILKRHETAKRP